MLVLKVGRRAEFVNMKSSDRRFAFNAVKRYLLSNCPRKVTNVRGGSIKGNADSPGVPDLRCHGAANKIMGHRELATLFV